MVDSLPHQSYQRKYTLHKPTGFTNNTQVPLVLMLHGGGGDMTSAQGFTRFNAVSNANGFLVAYPQGYGIIPSGGFSWADGRGTSADLAGIDDLGFINKLLDTLIANYAIDTNKIYLCGFSNGGFMTQRFACQMNRRFAAMASLGSIMDTSLFSSCNPQRPVPMMFVLGTRDPFVPFNGGPMIGSGLVTPVVSADSLVQFWKTNNNCQSSSPPLNVPDIDLADSSTVTVFNHSNCSCNSDVKFYKINGGGHTWPGVEIPSYELIAGQTNEDIQASDELWNFFKVHSLCYTSVGVNEKSLGNSIVVYPNPVNTTLFKKTENNNVLQYQITNALGRVMQQANLYDNSIDVSGLPKGIYFIQLKDDKGKYYASKFFKN